MRSWQAAQVDDAVAASVRLRLVLSTSVRSGGSAPSAPSGGSPSWTEHPLEDVHAAGNRPGMYGVGADREHSRRRQDAGATGAGVSDPLHLVYAFGRRRGVHVAVWPRDGGGVFVDRDVAEYRCTGLGPKAHVGGEQLSEGARSVKQAVADGEAEVCVERVPQGSHHAWPLEVAVRRTAGGNGGEAKARSVGFSTGRDGEHGIGAEPGVVKAGGRLSRSLVGEHAPDLRANLLVGLQLSRVSGPEQLDVGHRVPHKIRQAAGQLERSEPALSAGIVVGVGLELTFFDPVGEPG